MRNKLSIATLLIIPTIVFSAPVKFGNINEDTMIETNGVTAATVTNIVEAIGGGGGIGEEADPVALPVAQVAYTSATNAQAVAATKVPSTRTINGNALTSDVVLTPSDIGSLALTGGVMSATSVIKNNPSTAYPYQTWPYNGYSIAPGEMAVGTGSGSTDGYASINTLGVQGAGSVNSANSRADWFLGTLGYGIGSEFAGVYTQWDRNGTFTVGQIVDHDWLPGAVWSFNRVAGSYDAASTDDIQYAISTLATTNWVNNAISGIVTEEADPLSVHTSGGTMTGLLTLSSAGVALYGSGIETNFIIRAEYDGTNISFNVYEVAR